MGSEHPSIQMNYIEIFSYIESLNKNNSLKNFYDEIIAFENIHFIPAVRFDTALFLHLISNIRQPKNILEIGFGSGASTLFINLNSKPDIFISLERDKNRYLRGINLLNKYNISNIKLLHENAFNFFKTDTSKFDLIFLDSIKREYIDYLKPVKNILNKNGLLICDNILFNGKIADHDIVDKYKNGVHSLKLFNKSLSEDINFDTAFLPIGDGISISILK